MPNNQGPSQLALFARAVDTGGRPTPEFAQYLLRLQRMVEMLTGVDFADYIRGDEIDQFFEETVTSDGTALLLPGGTLICRANIVTTNRNGEVYTSKKWTFPKPFADRNYTITGNMCRDNFDPPGKDKDWSVYFFRGSATNVTVFCGRIADDEPADTDIEVSVTAIGVAA